MNPCGVIAGLLLTSLSVAAAQSINLQFVQQGKPVSDVAVVLTPLTAVTTPAQTAAIVDQVQKQFTPYVSVVQVGSKISFPNKDNIRHHVYSFSPAKPFELKLYSGTPSQPMVFDKTGTVVLGCNIHDWMLAYVLVVDTPYFAVSDNNGNATVNNLVSTRYRVHIWHPDQINAIADEEIDFSSTTAISRRIELETRARATTGPNNDDYR